MATIGACGSDDSPPAAPDDGGTQEASDEASPPPTDGGAEGEAGPAPVCNQTPCIVALAVGGTHGCGLTSDKNVVCWGSNLSGELGTGTVLDGGAFDGGASGIASAVGGAAGAVSVAAGGEGQSYDFSCSVMPDGTARCWGSNRYLQLGGGNDGGTALLSPTPAPVFGLTDVSSMKCGGAHACALLGNGGVSCWGFNGLDQLGRPGAGGQNGLASLTSIPAGRKASAIAAGQFHSCALLDDTTVWCWGENAKGQLGRTIDGGLMQDAIAQPVTGLSSAVDVAAGNFHSCARLTGGLLMCWGQNDHGQTGRGTGGVLIEPSPAIVALPAGSSVVRVSAGLLHTCALLSDASVWCWGGNSSGAVGPHPSSPDGGGFDPTDVYVPRKVVGLPGKPIDVAAGYLHSCALIEGGQVVCWGGNQFGELGRGTGLEAGVDTLPHPDPAPVKF